MGWADIVAGTAHQVHTIHSGVEERELTVLDLVDVSLVTRPMQRLARVHALEGS